MSFEDGHGPAEFQPVTVGSRGRRFDPVILGDSDSAAIAEGFDRWAGRRRRLRRRSA